MDSPPLPGLIIANDETLKRLAELATERAKEKIAPQFDVEQRAALVGVAKVFREPERLDRAEAYFARAEFWFTIRKFTVQHLKLIAYVVMVVGVLSQFKDQLFSMGSAITRAFNAIVGG